MPHPNVFECLSLKEVIIQRFNKKYTFDVGNNVKKKQNPYAHTRDVYKEAGGLSCEFCM